ncbi:hypothetical protein AGABI2DRAFT_190529 [Agaricus bisporus var. bisporus H97]|uniref:hypothetical protein n=1 Tax=Agaricus bisporus var. bisporus (strain H97 / ATCC MYA-4626 / FGSC 10389) TaxID=936046 RepID=UPI00029F75F5|nr:hypothetical protein AGABI2DRAFT_190529 [Agaricus bisporus var. bisporus H97]EKV50129.1 hypothetical protein AGABI2DRAFT_190529 [Agaricus bisporus var. bisporus H97]
MLRFSLRSFATSSSPRPWFVDPAFEHPRTPSPAASQPVAPVPHDAPPPVKLVHEALSRSPHLDLTTLVSRQTVDPRPGPPLPRRGPQGRRQRGATYAGESSFEVPGGIWRWTVMAQVKEGTENRGAIESVVRVVRKSLVAVEPPVPLGPKSKRRMENGWAMVDGGDFVVHILSREARAKYFAQDRFTVW